MPETKDILDTLPQEPVVDPAPAAPGPGIGFREPYRLTTPRGRAIRYPFPEAWDGQLEAVDAVLDVIEGTGSYVLLNGGTGFGKSPVLMGVASLFPSAWLLVGKRDLVEQWRRDYEELSHVGFLKSRQSFRCSVVPGADCSDGNTQCSSKRKEVWDAVESADGVERMKATERAVKWEGENGCPYKKNRDYALSKDHTVLTVQMALTIFTYLKEQTPGVVPRALLVVDECSELEEELIRFYETSLATRKILNLTDDDRFFVIQDEHGVADLNKVEMDRPKSLEEGIEWLTEVERRLGIVWGTISNIHTDDARDRAHKIGKIIQQIKCTLGAYRDKLPLAMEVEDDGSHRGHESYVIRIRPLEARGLFDRVLGSMADHCIFTSATTGPSTLFRDTHAMKRAIRYVEVGTPFPAEHRPIFAVQLAELNKSNFNRNIRTVAEGVVKVANNQPNKESRFNHREQKGIIHTYTYAVMKEVIEAFERAGMAHRLMKLSGAGPQRLEMFNMFKESKEPKILISPSAMLGVSLDDDLARWQVIVKVPYAYLGDPSVSHRMNLIDGWYSWQTSKNLIQSFGRIIRSRKDWGVTYVLDSCFFRHWRYNRDHFPDYIQQAVRFINKKTP